MKRSLPVVLAVVLAAAFAVAQSRVNASHVSQSSGTIAVESGQAITVTPGPFPTVNCNFAASGVAGCLSTTAQTIDGNKTWTGDAGVAGSLKATNVVGTNNVLAQGNIMGIISDLGSVEAANSLFQSVFTASVPAATVTVGPDIQTVFVVNGRSTFNGDAGFGGSVAIASASTISGSTICTAGNGACGSGGGGLSAVYYDPNHLSPVALSLDAGALIIYPADLDGGIYYPGIISGGNQRWNGQKQSDGEFVINNTLAFAPAGGSGNLGGIRQNGDALCLGIESGFEGLCISANTRDSNFQNKNVSGIATLSAVSMLENGSPVLTSVTASPPLFGAGTGASPLVCNQAGSQLDGGCFTATLDVFGSPSVSWSADSPHLITPAGVDGLVIASGSCAAASVIAQDPNNPALAGGCEPGACISTGSDISCGQPAGFLAFVSATDAGGALWSDGLNRENFPPCSTDNQSSFEWEQRDGGWFFCRNGVWEVTASNRNGYAGGTLQGSLPVSVGAGAHNAAHELLRHPIVAGTASWVVDPNVSLGSGAGQLNITLIDVTTSTNLFQVLNINCNTSGTGGTAAISAASIGDNVVLQIDTTGCAGTVPGAYYNLSW